MAPIRDDTVRFPSNRRSLLRRIGTGALAVVGLTAATRTAATRHKRTLVVIAQQPLLGYIPADPELYDYATIWKTIAAWAGEAPINPKAATWEGELQSFLADTAFLELVPEMDRETTVSGNHVPLVGDDQD